MRIRIHRGTAEIGGTCIEMEAADGRRIVVDLGRPLWADPDAHVPLPGVPGLATADPTLCGIVISPTPITAAFKGTSMTPGTIAASAMPPVVTVLKVRGGSSDATDLGIVILRSLLV